MTKAMLIGWVSPLALASITINAVCAQPLEEIVPNAVRGSQSLAADRATLDAQREGAIQARSAALPSVSVNGFAGGSDVTFDPGGDTDPFLSSLGFADFGATGIDPATTSQGVALSARQTIFAGGRVKNSIEAARASVRGAEAGYAAGMEDTIFEIVSAYYDVARAEAQTRALEQSSATLQEQQKAVTKSFELGRATRTDVVSVDAQLADVESKLATARAQANSATLNFQALTGLVLQQAFVSTVNPSYSDDIDELLTIMRASNANLRAAEALVQAGDANLRTTKGQHLPSVEITGNLSYAEGNIIEGDNIESASVQLQFSMPIFSGGRISSEVRQASAELRSSRFSQADINRRLESAVRAAYGEAIAAGVSRAAANAQLQARALAFEGVTIEAELGQRTTLEILDAEDDLLAAQFSFIDAQIREKLTIYNLLRLTGTLSESFGL